jgi:hypothetical protein
MMATVLSSVVAGGGGVWFGIVVSIILLVKGFVPNSDLMQRLFPCRLVSSRISPIFAATLAFGLWALGINLKP